MVLEINIAKKENNLIIHLMIIIAFTLMMFLAIYFIAGWKVSLITLLGYIVLNGFWILNTKVLECI